jgi:hypothetical protein
VVRGGTDLALTATAGIPANLLPPGAYLKDMRCALLFSLLAPALAAADLSGSWELVARGGDIVAAQRVTLANKDGAYTFDFMGSTLTSSWSMAPSNFAVRKTVRIAERGRARPVTRPWAAKASWMASP